jgi:hypothetical protein
MVLVAVSKHDSFEFVPVLSEEREVGQDQVDPRHLLVRKGQAGVDQNDAALLPHGGHVLAYLSQAPKRYDL